MCFGWKLEESREKLRHLMWTINAIYWRGERGEGGENRSLLSSIVPIRLRCTVSPPPQPRGEGGRGERGAAWGSGLT